MSENSISPSVYILAGPNGAGKSTFAHSFLSSFTSTSSFVNADDIARELSPANPLAAAFPAGRIMIDRLHELASARAEFAFETTLAGRGFYAFLQDLGAAGYTRTLFFLWLPTPDMALARVASRVRTGGHFVPDGDVRRRHQKGLENLFNLYRPVLDFWYLFDATTPGLVTIACEEQGQFEVLDGETYSRVLKGMSSHE